METIEVEHRSRISELKYHELLEFLLNHGKDLGENNKFVYHFIFPDKLLNIVNEESKKKAKIALKLGKIGKDESFKETELPIDPKDFETAAQLFRSLGMSDVQVMDSRQIRHDFEYKGVEIAVKHSDSWGHHVELEVLVADSTDIPEAEKKISEIADELGLHIMTKEELKSFTEQMETEWKAKNSK
jgi:predicted adenylyl cyclase CyaB